jgi:acetylornithine deacetylase/succinyl-diaminopimelate desuccinylase-like protein
VTSNRPTLRINSERLLRDFEQLSEIGATVGGGVSRLALSNEDLAARSWFADRIEEAGLQVRDDEVGNLSGWLCADDPGAKTLMIGSHLDTVPNGGRYDGAIGVLIALECLRRINEAGLKPRCHLEAINFTDEEGAWKSLFGSNGVIGKISAADIDDALLDNMPFRAALYRAGIMLEEIQNARRDALQGAAVFIISAHQLIRSEYADGVVNCGHLSVALDSFNVVPAEASLRMEIRHPETPTLVEMEARPIRLARECARDHRLTVSTQRVLYREAERMSPEFARQFQLACGAENVRCMPIASYSGHNAKIMNQMAPAGMIFLPSVDGISHNPREFTEWRHVELGANVLLRTILQLTL